MTAAVELYGLKKPPITVGDIIEGEKTVMEVSRGGGVALKT